MGNVDFQTSVSKVLGPTVGVLKPILEGAFDPGAVVTVIELLPDHGTHADRWLLRCSVKHGAGDPEDRLVTIARERYLERALAGSKRLTSASVGSTPLVVFEQEALPPGTWGTVADPANPLRVVSSPFGAVLKTANHNDLTTLAQCWLGPPDASAVLGDALCHIGRCLGWADSPPSPNPYADRDLGPYARRLEESVAAWQTHLPEVMLVRQALGDSPHWRDPLGFFGGSSTFSDGPPCRLGTVHGDLHPYNVLCATSPPPPPHSIGSMGLIDCEDASDRGLILNDPIKLECELKLHWLKDFGTAARVSPAISAADWQTQAAAFAKQIVEMESRIRGSIPAGTCNCTDQQMMTVVKTAATIRASTFALWPPEQALSLRREHAFCMAALCFTSVRYYRDWRLRVAAYACAGDSLYGYQVLAKPTCAAVEPALRAALESVGTCSLEASRSAGTVRWEAEFGSPIGSPELIASRFSADCPLVDSRKQNIRWGVPKNAPSVFVLTYPCQKCTECSC